MERLARFRNIVHRVGCLGIGLVLGGCASKSPPNPVGRDDRSAFDLMTTAVALGVPAESTETYARLWNEQAVGLADALVAHPADTMLSALSRNALAYVSASQGQQRRLAQAVAAVYVLEKSLHETDEDDASTSDIQSRWLSRLDSSRFTSPYLVGRVWEGASPLPQAQRQRIALNARTVLESESPNAGTRQARMRDSLLAVLTLE